MGNSRLHLATQADDDKPHNSSRGKGILLETPYKPGFVDDLDLETVKMAVDKELSHISNAFYQSTEQAADTITRVDRLEVSGDVQYGEIKAEIERVDTVSKEGDRALAASVTTLSAKVDTEFGEVNAQIKETNKVMADQDKILAEKIDAITGSFEGDLGGLFAVIEEVRQITITGDEALAKSIDETKVEFKAADATLTAGIKTEETSRVTADEALSKRVDTVSAEWKNADASLVTKFEGEIDKERVAREVQQAVLDGKITQEQADRILQDEDLLRQLIQEQKDRENGDNANAEQIKVVKAAVTTESEARADADGALGKRIDTVTAEYKLADKQIGDVITEKVTELNAAIRTESLARADADSALASQITVIEAGYKSGDKNLQGNIDKNLVDVNASIKSEAVARSDADGALGKRVDTVTANYKAADKVLEGQIGNIGTSSDAAVKQEAEARANADGALGRRIDSVTASYQSADSALNTSFTGKIDKERVDRELAIAVAEGKITTEQANRIKEDEELLRKLIQEQKDRDKGDKDNAAEIVKTNAAVVTEATARADADKALAGQITTVSAEWKKGDSDLSTSFTGKIDQEKVDRALAIAVTEGKITQEQADRIKEDEELLRDLIQEKLNRENGDKANAAEIVRVNAAVTTESNARADADKALASQISTVSAEWKKGDSDLNTSFTGKIDKEKVDRELAIAVTEGKITQEQADRISQDDALLRDLIQEKKDRDNGDKANASEIIKVNAAISTESTARADADKALASQITTVSAEWKQGDIDAGKIFQGKIDAEKVARELADNVADGKLTQAQADLIAGDEVLLRKLIQEQKDRESGDANAVKLFQGEIDKERVAREVADALAEGKITKTQADLITGDEDLLRKLIQEKLDRESGDKTNGDEITIVKASVKTESEARASQDSALAGQITTAKSELNGTIASVQQTLQTSINSVDGKVNQVNSKWGISVDAGGNVAGIQLNSSSTGGSEFRVLADRFVFTNGSTNIKPISIEGAYAVFNNIIVRDNCIVQGTIYADKIQGSVSSTVALGQMDDQTYNLMPAPRDRTLLISGVNAYAAGGQAGSGSSLRARIEMNSWVNGVHALSWHEESGSNRSWKSMGRTLIIPANTPVSVRIQMTKNTPGTSSAQYSMEGAFVMLI